MEGEQPLFGPNGEIFFRRIEGASAFLYSIREDGTGLRKALESTVVDLFGADAGHKRLLLGALTGEGNFFFRRAMAPLRWRLEYPPPELAAVERRRKTRIRVRPER